MNFVRPAVRQVAWRYRDALLGAVIALVGLYWASISFGTIVLVAGAISIAGVLLFVTGIQRGRFRRGAGGAGVVDILEGQLTYFGPFGGGSVGIEDLVMVELIPRGKGPAEWVLHSGTEQPLRVPAKADGSDALFDVFAGLDGIETERMLVELNKADGKPVVIWQKRPAQLH